MAVDPDELLIFKMRGVKSAQKKPEEKAEIATAPQPQPQAQAAAQPQINAMPEEAKERKPFFAPRPKPTAERPTEMQQKHSFFAPKPKPAPRIVEKPAQPRPAEVKQKKPLFAAKPKPAPKEEEHLLPEEMENTPGYLQNEESRLRELEALEQAAALYERPPEGLEAEEAEALGTAETKTMRNAFSTITGMIFVVDAIVFGYFVYPQAAFVLGYIAQNGIGSFGTWNYELGTSLINIILILLSVISGALMLANVSKGHLVTGATGSIILLAVSFEYLNSSAFYLLIVSVLTFAGVASLAYARMSAISVMEEETEALPAQQEISWPRIETF
ncbi:MAG: hypothetical protein KGH57_02730 [Candidatus Micrarchaeota archaeon]|nr:hypothetical protein [Candidatus Micrarchaeota archaeon]